ncbi:MAG: Na+/H+ antiporter subunit E [Phycisphaerales bacterium]
MRQFLFNLVLALTWCLLTGGFGSWNFIAGLLVGSVVVSAYTNATGQGGYYRRMWRVFSFACYFFTILVKSNLQIAWEVATPGWGCTPRVIRYPVGELTDVQRVTLANCITLTPGTLVMDISPDKQFLYIHCMYGKHRDTVIKDIDDLASRLQKGVFS